MNKILFSSKNVNILLSIKKTFYIFKVFVTFRYRIGSISKALLSNIFASVFCFWTGKIQGKGIQDRRDAGQERFRTGGIQDRRDSGQEGYKTEGMQNRKDSGQEGCRLDRMQDR